MHSSTDIPKKEPSEIIIGDTIKWRREDLSAHYPASSWTLNYALRGPAVIDITATADGDNFSVSVAKTTTAGWTVGDYWWAAYVSKGTERYQIDSGTVKLKPNLSAIASGTYDGRSDAKIAYDNAIDIWKNVKRYGSYSIAGRTFTLRDMPEIIAYVDRCKADYLREVKAEKIANGEASGGKVLVRFT